MKVLVIEDDRRIAAVLKQALSEDGHTVDLVLRGDEGLQLLQTETFDIAVLDIMLPGLDGFSLLTRLRERHNDVSVLVLTARDAMPDMVRGLDLGADDYLTKPFQLEVLLARVRALSRRGTRTSSNELRVGNLVLDREQRALYRAGEPVALTRKEFLLLELLMRRGNQVVTRDQLVEAGWGLGDDVSDNNVDFYISSLRAKIATAGQPSYIRTLRSLGYSFTVSHAV